MVDNVTVKDVWSWLQTDPQAVLIDVRTPAEWSFVGLPDLSSMSRRPVLLEWLTYPDSAINPAFVDQLVKMLGDVGAGTSTHLYFICRSGARSAQAATAMTAAGYQHCHNVAEGFEGPLDSDRHRGVRSGWKAEGLPWVQS